MAGALQKLIAVILIVGGISSGILLFMSELAGEEGYDIDVSNDTAYNSTFNKIEETTEGLEEHYVKLQNLPQNKAAAFFTGIIEVFSILVSFLILPFELLINLWTSFATALSLPAWLTAMVTGLISLAIIFAFAAVILKWKA